MKELILKAKKEVFSNQTGLFSAKRGKDGYDFFDLEEYDFRSDAKRIDWKSFAKTQKLYSKIYQEELLKNILLIPLITGSLYFGKERLKIEMMIETLSLIAFSAIKERAKLKIKDIYIKNIYDLENYLNSLYANKIIGKKESLNSDIFFKYNQKHLTIIISDFLEFIDLSLFSSKDDVVAIILKDGFEATCKANLVDNESLKSLSYKLDKKSLNRYRQNIQKIHLQQKEHFLKHKIDFIEIYENDNIFQKLFLFFKER